MASRHLLFKAFYRLGFTPWDGHQLATTLRDLVEGPSAMPAGVALDIGCGTGDTSIYLAQQGWKVTGIDFVHKAVDKARAKAQSAGVDVDFRHGDATRLTEEGVEAGVTLIVDNGCIHGMSDDDRASYVREVTAVAAPHARLLLVEFTPGGSFAVPGIGQDEIERRFASDWTLLSTGDEPNAANRYGKALRHYLLERKKG